MFCSQCGKANVEGIPHCAACGAPLAIAGSGSRAQSPAPLFAGFWRRVAAYLVDSLILFIPSLVFALLVPGMLEFLAQVIVWIIYKTALEGGERQATLGKRALGIKVTGPDGGRISYGRAAGRAVGFYVSAIPLMIGLAMAGLTKRKQALHDMMSSTLVVNAAAEESEVAAGRTTGTMPMTAGVWIAVIVLVFVPFFLGIVAAVAIPAYQDYLVRAKMMEVVSEGGRVKAQSQEVFARARKEGSAPARSEVPPTSKYVKRITVDPAAATVRTEIDTVRFGSPQVAEGSAVIHTLGEGGWKCRGVGVPDKYLPQACRQ